MKMSLISQSEKARIILAYLQTEGTFGELILKMPAEMLDRAAESILTDNAPLLMLTVAGSEMAPIKLKSDPKMVKMAAKISNLTDSNRQTFELIQKHGPVTRDKLNDLHEGVTDGAVGARIYALGKLGLIKSELASGSKVTKVYFTDYVASTSPTAKKAGEALMSLEV